MSNFKKEKPELKKCFVIKGIQKYSQAREEYNESFYMRERTIAGTIMEFGTWDLAHRYLVKNSDKLKPDCYYCVEETYRTVGQPVVG